MATTATDSEFGTQLGIEADFPPHRITLDRWLRMIEAGVYGEEDGVFLRHGNLVEKDDGRPSVPGVATGPGVAESRFVPHCITVDRYERLVESGVYDEKDPVFLWRGRLVEKMTPGQPHVFIVSKLNRLFFGVVPPGWYSLQEQPFSVATDGMPEPDISVVRGELEDYLDRRPTGRDVALVIEVSDSTLRADSGEVLRAYAKEGIPVYWIVNIPKRRIEVYADPTGPSDAPTYRERRDYGPTDEVPVILDGREVGRIAVQEIFR